MGKTVKPAVTFWQIGGFKISLGLLSRFSDDGLGLLTPQCLEYFSNVCQFSCTVLIKVKAPCQEMGARKLSTPRTLEVFKLQRPGSLRTLSANMGIPKEGWEFGSWHSHL